MIDRIISGGQSGADQSGWRAAKAVGIPCSGWMPLGYLTEDGPRPEFAELYGAREMPTASYAARTKANVRECDAAIWFGNPDSPGGRATFREAHFAGKPIFTVRPGVTVGQVVRIVQVHPHCTAWLVCGNRESRFPGIGARTERFLGALFDRLASAQAP